MTVSTRQLAQLTHLLGTWMATTVYVETYQGETGYGPSYAAPVAVVCDVAAKRQLVRDANGDEVVSEFIIHAPAASEASFTPESRVTIGGRVSTVLAVGPKGFRGETAWVEVACS